MWSRAEVVALLDREGVICTISRNEEEAIIREPIGRSLRTIVAPECLAVFEEAFRKALDGETSEILAATIGDDGSVRWGRTQFKPSPLPETPVMVHGRRLPKCWSKMSSRERDVVSALHGAGLNPKKAARRLGISLNTLNAHRRSITQKCHLDGVGDFWVFVERCR